ncbi:MAG: fixJ [Caulobacteraceae bacterium]|jgi:FixJ family two-component response regulator|nr:fixJ [Caulobacteraceae bacterium]
MPQRTSFSKRTLDASPPLVVIVDDDASTLEALECLLVSVGLEVQAFASAQACLDGADRVRAGCIVLDVRLPGKNGLELHEELKRAGLRAPVVFISGYGDVRMTVRAMKAGAVEFLSKPFHEQELLDAIQVGIEQDRVQRERQDAVAAVQARFATLTPREREIMSLVVLGLRNKAIATEFGLSEVTVKAHRRQVMSKMSAPSLADLVRMGDLLCDASS